MSIRRLISCLFLVFVAVALVWVLTGSRLSSQAVPQTETVLAGRNVNMVSGDVLPGGDPWLQRQNEPSIAVSSRNPLHLLAGANDYRTVDMPTSEGELPGKQPTAAVGDAWLGVFTSYDGGESWTSTMLPGFPQDPSANPLKGYGAAADPVVRSGPNGLFYYSGIAFKRDTNVGVVFVARFIDDNNKEGGRTIRYIDTKIIAKGTSANFLDKPWISVDQPRLPVANITISGQSFPRHNVYIAYSAFSGAKNTLGDIMFARSADCGTTWGTPIKISSGSYAHQGATIAIKPVIGEVLVAWRRFGVSGKTPDSIYVAQSFSRGLNFQSPVKVADVAPFDQPTTTESQALPGTGVGFAFRTNSYPTMTVDKSGHVYLAWAQRGVGQGGGARIVISSSYIGSNWSVPQAVANLDENGLPFLGHQLMPSMSFAAGKLILVWYDQRHDLVGNLNGFNNWILDDQTYRHVMDVWAAEADTSKFPNLSWKSSQVSRYLYTGLKNASGDIVTDSAGNVIVIPVQFNCVNYPLFKGGHNPFNGDYIDVAAAPTFKQDSWRNWIFNTDGPDKPVFHVAWTDNRDVRPPSNNNWTVYTPPVSTQGSSYVSPERPGCNPNGSGNEPGMRNQNIYTARVTWGIEAGSPVNDKPLNLPGSTARAFVVFVKNNTGGLRSFRLTIAAQPVGGQASFLQFSLLTTLDVEIAPFSTISRPVFIKSTDINAAVTVNIKETDASGAVIAGGLSSSVLINGDTSNPQMSGNVETHNPNIVNSANPNIVNWFVNPNIVNPNIVNPSIGNPNIVNPNIVNPNIVNPNIVNPNIVNPNIVNPNIVNPNIVNPNIVNPNIVNPNIVNPNIVNPNIVNANPEDVTSTDVEWTVKNEGSATTSYTLKTLAKKSPPEGVYVQLLVYRVHYTPAIVGADFKSANPGSDACTLRQEPHHELVLSIVNPNIVNPNIVNPNIVNPNIVNASIENASFSVAPGEEVVVDLRVLDKGVSTTSGAKAANAMSRNAATQAFSVQDFIDSLGFAVTSQAVNSTEAAQGVQVPPADATDLVIGTASLPDGVVGYSYNATLSAFGGTGNYNWTLNAGELPLGLVLGGTGVISGTPTVTGTYQFIVRVDAGGQFDTQQYSIFIDSNTTPDTLSVITTSLPNGVAGHWYGATLVSAGGVYPRSWSLSSGALPDGLSLDSGGVISGTPTAAGTSNFIVRVADRNGTIATRPLSIIIAAETGAYFEITGIVYSETNGLPLAGVVMRGLPNTPVTGADGVYTDRVPANWSGTAIPFMTGHTFSPASINYPTVTSNKTGQDYNAGFAVPTISGAVLFGTTPLPGVVMNGLPGNPATNASGAYTVTVSRPWTGTVTPTLAGYTFTPPSKTYTNVTTPQVTNYTAAPVGPQASKLVFTQNPSGGIGGTYWAVQPKVEIQDSAGTRIHGDNSTIVTLALSSNPGGGMLSGVAGVQVVDGEASFAGLSIDRGGQGYILQATSVPTLSPGTSGAFNIEGFSDRAPMSADRQFHTATFLYTDKILVAGGMNSTGFLQSAELYDPETDTFTPLGNMSDWRGEHTATPLLNGKILIAGGGNLASTAELFNPAGGTFTFTGSMTYNRQRHAASRLQDGRVLVTGGSPHYGDTAEIYDPITATFSVTGAMHEERTGHTSTWLPNGKVLITGGGAYISSAELFDPATGTFSTIGSMAGGARFDHAATLLNDGTVLITGGTNNAGNRDTAEIFDPATNTFTATGSMHGPHTRHNALLLRDGTVLIVGGGDPEIYDPATHEFRLTGPGYIASSSGNAAATTKDGLVFVTGGSDEGVMSGTEMWNPLVPFPTHVISGRVTHLGVGVPGVLMSGFPGYPITDYGGYYEAVVMNGWTGTVTPTKPGFTFNPPSIAYLTGITTDTSSQDYTVTSAAAFKLAFVQQPRNTLVNARMMPPATVEIQDELGNLITTATDTVVLSLSSNPGGATLNGTISRAAVGGVATFNDLSLNHIGAGYTLAAASGSLLAAVSAPFDIITGGTDQASAPLITTGTYQDYFGASEYEHWFKVVATEGQDIRVSTGSAQSPSSPDNLDLDVFIYDGTGHMLVCSYSGRSEEAVYLSNVHVGTYYIMIWSGNQDLIYTLTVTQGDLTGIGEITGQITNSLGGGVGNFLVEAYLEGDGTYTGLQEVAVTDSDGRYKIAFTPGNYKLNITFNEVLAVPSDPYVLPQWYQGKTDFASANVVSISGGGTNGGHDDQLADGAAISGRVTSVTGEPIVQTLISVVNPDGSATGGFTRANNPDYLVGHIRVPSEGQIKVRFTGIGGYIVAWYNGKYSLAGADPISVQPRVTTPLMDVHLLSDIGAGSIQGRVTDGVGNGLYNVTVRAYDFAQGEVRYATTDSTGNFSISALPTFGARVYFDAGQTAYASKWYNDKNSFASADVVNVVHGSATTGINAILGPKTIQVSSPNGGEGWAVGSSQNITWTSSLGVGNIRIQVSTNGGTDFSDIVASTANTGSYAWVVSDSPSASCLIRISDAATGTPFDVSDARFTIAAAGVPRRLAFVQQPTGTVVNGTINPPVTVEIQDALGNRVTTATNTVVLSLRNAGTAILSGNLSKAAVGGIATFNDLSINTAGTGYLLRANSGSLTEVDSSTFDITAPEISIRQDTNNIPDGGNYDFGTHVSGSATDLTFTVDNTGTGPLIFSGLPIVMGGVDGDSFSVQQQPATPVSPGGSTSFVIRFSPTSPGTKTASISIANNDPDEHPYDIVFQGAATAAMVAVAGTITYNDSPITSKTSATPIFLMEDLSTGLPATFTSTYNNSTGGYSINVAPGTYHITAHFDTALPTNGTFMPGDYYCMQNDVVIPSGGMTLNLGCQLLMHMTSPIDNLTPQTWEYGSLGGELTFTWDAVPEAAKYRVEIHKYTDAGVYEGNAISPADISAPTTQFSCTLPLNGPDKHYRLILRAFKGDVYASTMVGMLIVVYDWPNWSNVYRFKSRGLIGYYPFRGNANDESGYGNNGTINGGAVFAADRFGAANGSLTFDGVDDFVELPNESWFDLPQITIVAIAKISDLETSSPIISKGDEFGSFTVSIGNSPNLRPYYTYRTSTGNEGNPLSNNPVPLNEFFQLVSTYDSATRQLKGYVNGLPKLSGTTMMSPVMNDQNVTIGLSTFVPPASSRHFVGTIDEIRIYNRILSPTEVLALYSATGDGDYELITKWGSSGTGNGQFDHAFGVAVDNSGYVYVADTDNHRIQKFTTNGDFVTTWGSLGSGDGQFNYPKGIAVDNSGNVYVVEYGNHRVQKFNSLGTFVTKWGSYGTTGDGEFQGPGGIAVDNSGFVYVADTYNHRIQKFTSDGTFLAKWGSQGSGDGQFNYPWGIGIDISGEIFVADSLNRRIQKFTSDGTFVTKWGSQGSADGQFEQPAGLAVDSSGYVYVVEYSNHRIQKFTSGGQFVVKWGSLGSGNGQFVYPSGIAVDASGYVYVNDTNNFRIQKFRKK